MDKIKYLEYLESYLTPRRKALFDKVLSCRTRHFTLVAEDTYKNHNASALIRTCDCFGIQDLHIIEEQNQYRVAKGMTQGSEKWVDLHIYNQQENNIQPCIDRLRADGFAIVSTTPHANDQFVADYDIRQKTAFFFGRERTGLSPDILEQSDAFLKIPMFGFTESYNISVSAALLLQSVIQRLHECSDVKWQLSDEEKIDLKIAWCIKTIQNGEKIAQRYQQEYC